MPANLDIAPIVPVDEPVPLNVASLMAFLQNRNDTFAVRLVDVLFQLQNAINIIWGTLQAEFPQTDTIELYGPTGDPVTIVAPEGFVVRNNDGANEDRASLLVGGDSVALTLVRNGITGVDLVSDATGIRLSLAAGGIVKVNNIQVLTNQQSTVNAVAATAGATYTATEQAMLNEIKARFNEMRDRLRTHGLIA